MEIKTEQTIAIYAHTLNEPETREYCFRSDVRDFLLSKDAIKSSDENFTIYGPENKESVLHFDNSGHLKWGRSLLRDMRLCEGDTIMIIIINNKAFFIPVYLPSEVRKIFSRRWELTDK